MRGRHSPTISLMSSLLWLNDNNRLTNHTIDWLDWGCDFCFFCCCCCFVSFIEWFYKAVGYCREQCFYFTLFIWSCKLPLFGTVMCGKLCVWGQLERPPWRFSALNLTTKPHKNAKWNPSVVGYVALLVSHRCVQ